MKKSIILLLCCLVTMAVQAAKVKESEARSKAQHFIEKRSVRAKSLKRTAHVEPSCGAFYVFNMEDDGGYVIISADDRTEAVLGYADSGSFDMQRLPSHVRAWLQGYADQIAEVRSGRAQPLRAAQAAELHEAIKPLLTTRWDQGNPYNLQCPPECATGCVATAMAQVMRYHQWPEGETTEIPAYYANATLDTLQALPPTVFDWDLMTDTYNAHSTDEEQQAVARLMRYCGQSVEMDYGESSGTQTAMVVAALRNYFGYDVSTRSADRDAYTARSWDQLIYQELAAQRPVVYSGKSTGGGHAFICDGYDGNGFYHINWGWGGMNDGYYRLSVLNPAGGGTGSSGTEDGYAMDQQAIIGIQKATGSSSETDDMRILSLYNMWADADSHQLTVQLLNNTGLTGTFRLGFAYHNIAETSLNAVYRTVELGYHYYASTTVDVTTLGLEDGTYRFYPYSQLEGTEAPLHIYGDYSAYIEVVIKDGTYQFDKHPSPSLGLNNVECMGNKVVNMSQEVRVTISNDGDEYNGIIYLFASQTDQRGSYVNKTAMVIERGEQEEASLYFTPTAMGTWHLWVGNSDDASRAVGPFDVTVKAAPTAATNLAVVSESMSYEGSNTVMAQLKNNGTQGYYRSINCILYSGETGNWGEYQTQLSSGNMNLAPQQSAHLKFSFDAVTPGQKYIAVLYAFKNHSDDERMQVGEYFEFTARDPYSETITLTACDTTRVYGDENPAFTFVASGDEELTGTPALSCAATAKTSVGSYPITISRGTVTNVNLELVNGTLTITKAPLTITCESYTIKQGDELPRFMLKAEGFRNGDNSRSLKKMPTIYCEATQGCEPGEYAITASGAEAKNYDISYVAGVLTVLPADPVTITANSYTREYGDENPSFAFIAEGAALQGQPEISCEATATSPVGTYPIVIRKGSVTNYNVELVNGTLTIERAPLTITAKSYEIEVGDELPQFGFTTMGFKNGEDPSVLTRQPVISCAATALSGAGDYPITISGAEAKNYSISYVAGMLTVKVPMSIAAMTAAGIPFDVYNLKGQLVRRQTTSTQGLSAGYYVINQRVVFIPGKI